MRPRVSGEIGRRARGRRNRAGADGNMHRRHTHDINQQRHRQDRAATADQSERKPD